MKQIRTMVKKAIDLKREELKNGDQDSDLLASLLQVKDETTGEGIPESLIIDESLTFLFAGHGNIFKKLKIKYQTNIPIQIQQQVFYHGVCHY